MTEKNQQLLQELKNGGVKFLPWIGDKYEDGIYYDETGELRYGNGKGKKVLVLNECIYGGETEKDAKRVLGESKHSWLVYEIINRFIDNSSNFPLGVNHRPFVRFERTLAGKEPLSIKERIELWNHLTFYTYIQEQLDSFTPTEKQYKDAKKSFLFLIDKCRPDIIIVWGRRLYYNLPISGQQGKDIWTDDEYTETWNFCRNNHNIKILQIPYPSYIGFVSANWHKIIREFITRRM